MSRSIPILFATSRKRPHLTASDTVVAAALRERAIEVHARPWDEIDPHDPATTLVCLRSTWDYHLRASEFHAWVRAFDHRPGALWNPPDTVRWNADKQYLRDLERAGITIPRTQWIDPGTRIDLQALAATAGWTRAVLKPRVSASAHGTHLVDPETILAPDEWAALAAHGALLQEFLPEIGGRGEVSLVFIDRAFSHAARKVASPGEFRVQSEFGGHAVPIDASASLVAFGVQVLAACPVPALYARVDVVEADRGPVLMELELIEPELFFALYPARAGAFADALLARVSVRAPR